MSLISFFRPTPTLCGGSLIDGVSNDALTWLIRGGFDASVVDNDFLALEHG